MTVGIVDYGCGNLFSLNSSFNRIGAHCKVVSTPKELYACDKIVLPGVGAFADAISKLKSSGMADAVIDFAKVKPLLGVCLGMQMLFDKSYEYGEHAGLSLIRGVVKPLAGHIDSSCKIPQMGWNALEIKKRSKLFKYLKGGEYVYFVHSYYACDCESSVTATVNYGGTVTAAVEKDNVYGTQFHPEKSGEVGLNILKAFTEL